MENDYKNDFLATFLKNDNARIEFETKNYEMLQEEHEAYLNHLKVIQENSNTHICLLKESIQASRDMVSALNKIAEAIKNHD